MKKIISVIIISLLLLASVIVEQIYKDNTMNTLIDKIQVLNAEINNSETINTSEIQYIINDLDKYWEKQTNILRITINNNDLSRIGEQIKKVKVYIEQNDKDNCLYEIDTLEFYAENYKVVMELNFQNIM